MTRREEREWLVKLAYERQINKEEKPVAERLASHGLDAGNEYLAQSLQSLEDHEEEINQVIKDHLTNWSFDRLLRLDRAILQLAVNEMVFTQLAPPAVTINESVEIAKVYSDRQAYRFINGVLAGVSKDLK